MHRQHEHPQPGSAAVKLTGRLESGHPRHGDVEDGQVDLGLEPARHRLASVARFGDDRQVRLLIEHEA